MMVISLDRWKGKLAIVTGASSGIGEAITIQLVQAGVHVLGIARGVDKLLALSERLQNEQGKFHYYIADCSKEEDVFNVFQWSEANLGPVHILINNAGLRVRTNLIEGNTELWKHLLDVNILGVCMCTREAFRIMKKNKIDGHIINMGSYGGHTVVYNSGSNLYPASKFALRAMTETLRQELNVTGSKIKITGISPGLVKTNFRTFKSYPPYDQLPHLSSEDVADAVMYALGTPAHVQIHDIIIKPVGEQF